MDLIQTIIVRGIQMLTIIAMIPDCFVGKTLKTHGGHGEAKLYVGNNDEHRDILCQKPIYISYSDEYLEIVKKSPHAEYISEHIKKIDNYAFLLVPRVKQDCRRMYIGPTDSRDKYWTFFRQTLLSYQSCIIFEESDTHIIATIKPSCYFKSKAPIGYSKAAIDWLTYIENKDKIKIQHVLNGGEFCIKTKRGYRWPADGFCKDTNTVYEFQGDYWHGNPSIYSADDTFHGIPYSKKWEKDALKKKSLEDLGFNVVTIWESDWFKIKKSLN